MLIKINFLSTFFHFCLNCYKSGLLVFQDFQHFLQVLARRKDGSPTFDGAGIHRFCSVFGIAADTDLQAVQVIQTYYRALPSRAFAKRADINWNKQQALACDGIVFLLDRMCNAVEILVCL